MIINSIRNEIKHRVAMILISILIVTLLMVQYTNDIIILLLHPIKNTHTDWHMYLLYNIISTSFEICDNDIPINRKTIEHSTFDYVPVIEVNMNVSNINIAIIKVILHISLILAYIIIRYQTYLFYTPSIYKHEQYTTITMYVKTVFALIIAAIITHDLWTFIYFNISLHNYNELNFYEFDVDLDINDYINKYILAYYLHLAMLCITNTRLSVLIITYLVTVGLILNFEILYFVVIWFIISYKKRRTWLNIVENSSTIRYLKEYCVVRMNRNDK